MPSDRVAKLLELRRQILRELKETYDLPVRGTELHHTQDGKERGLGDILMEDVYLLIEIQEEMSAIEWVEYVGRLYADAKVHQPAGKLQASQIP